MFNLIIRIPGLEYTGISSQVLENLEYERILVRLNAVSSFYTCITHPFNAFIHTKTVPSNGLAI